MSASPRARTGIFCFRRPPCAASQNSPEITGIYRQHNQNSRTILPEEQWAKDFKLIRSKLEDTWIILPKGESSRIVAVLEANLQLKAAQGERDATSNQLQAVESERNDAASRLRVLEGERDEAANRAQLVLRLRRAMRRHVKRKIITLRLRRALSFWSRRRCRRLGAKIEEYKGYLAQL